MVIKTRVFELYKESYQSLPELARAIGVSASQAYRIREGKRNINNQFIIGSIKAFPGYKLGELFYLDSESSAAPTIGLDLDSVAR